MKIYTDLIAAMVEGGFGSPLYTKPKGLYGLPILTVTGRMFNIAIEMIIDGKY